MREIEGSSGPDTAAQALSQLPDGQPEPFSSPPFFFPTCALRERNWAFLCLKRYTARQAESCVISYYLMLDDLYGLIKYVRGDCNTPLYMCPGLLLKQNTAYRSTHCCVQRINAVTLKPFACVHFIFYTFKRKSVPPGTQVLVP